MPKDFNNIRAWLYPLIEERGWSIEEFGRKIGVTRAAIYHYMTDKRRPTVERMRQICEVLGVPASEGLAQFTPKEVGRPKGFH
jgi:transcriptional regulator with XRE-family HTH domain